MLTEWDYSRLEECLGRYAEIRRGVRLNQPVRVERGRLIPSRTQNIPVPETGMAKEKISLEERTARKNRDDHLEKIKNLYSYHLTRRNCVTELVRNIQAAFPGKDRAVEVLGGRIEPGKNLTYIPFRLFQKIRECYRVEQITVMPSYRNRQLARMYDSSSFAPVYFRECNVITSSLYTPLKEDTPFLFFTDDVTWARPLYGLVNTAWGTVSAGLGVITLPADGGERLSGGLWGMVFSFPELFFCNIRKGSFNYVEEGGPEALEMPLERAEPAFDRRVAP